MLVPRCDHPVEILVDLIELHHTFERDEVSSHFFVSTRILCSRLLAWGRWEYQSRSQSIVTLTSLRRAARPLPGLLHLQTR